MPKKKTPASLNPKELIREVVRLYAEDQGASTFGSYRDVVIDLLHLASDDKALMKDTYLATLKGKADLHQILDEGWSGYLEERQNNEIEKIGNIKRKDLPLHIHDEWEFEESKEYFKERLSGKEK